MSDLYIKDLYSGKVRKYGSNPHDSLHISPDGKFLTYYNLQNGDGSGYGDYRFTDEKGNTPEEIAERENCIEIAFNCYFNIGGFNKE